MSTGFLVGWAGAKVISTYMEEYCTRKTGSDMARVREMVHAEPRHHTNDSRPSGQWDGIDGPWYVKWIPQNGPN
jgi:hypothetical protein